MISSVVRTVLVYLAVVVAMRLMGKRQLGELQPAELVTTLLISNVASICIDEPDLPLSASLVPIFLITTLEILNSTLVWFCPKYAQLLLGKPVTIIRNGEILQDELAQLRITASDLAEALRGKDIFSPKDVYWGVIEPNGTGSILVVKDSYANSFVPYLTENYAKIGVVDFRNFKYGLDSTIEKEGYDEVLVLYNFQTFIADTNLIYISRPSTLS